MLFYQVKNILDKQVRNLPKLRKLNKDFFLFYDLNSHLKMAVVKKTLNWNSSIYNSLSMFPLHYSGSYFLSFPVDILQEIISLQFNYVQQVLLMPWGTGDGSYVWKRRERDEEMVVTHEVLFEHSSSGVFLLS